MYTRSAGVELVKIISVLFFLNSIFFLLFNTLFGSPLLSPFWWLGSVLNTGLMDGERDLTTPTCCDCSSLDEKIDATLASIVKLNGGCQLSCRLCSSRRLNTALFDSCLIATPPPHADRIPNKEKDNQQDALPCAKVACSMARTRRTVI